MPGPNRIRVRSINHAANSKKIALCLVPRSSIFALCQFNLGHLPTRHRKEFIAKRRAHDQRQHSNYVWTGSESFRSEPDRIGFCLHGTVWNRSSCFTCNRLEPVRYESKRIQNWICESADPFRTSSRMVACKQKAYPVRYSDRIRLESFPVNIARDLKTDILESFKNGTHSGLFQFPCKNTKQKTTGNVWKILRPDWTLSTTASTFGLKCCKFAFHLCIPNSTVVGKISDQKGRCQTVRKELS